MPSATPARRSMLKPVSSKKDDAGLRLLRESMSEVARPAASIIESNERKPKKKRQSRFFFPLEMTISEEVKQKRELIQISRKNAIDADAETTARVEAYRNELPEVVQKNVDIVREFFLKQINPLILASSVGAAQAQDVIQKLLNANVDLGPYVHFDKMIRKATQVRLTEFVSKYLGVDAESLKDVVYPEPPKKVLIDHEQKDPIRSSGTVSRTVPKRRKKRSPDYE